MVRTMTLTSLLAILMVIILRGSLGTMSSGRLTGSVIDLVRRQSPLDCFLDIAHSEENEKSFAKS